MGVVSATLRWILALTALPITVTVVIPWLLHVLAGYAAPWSGIALDGWTVLGVIVVLIGLALLVWTSGLFGRKGRGTLAPWDPPKRMVIAGPYRFVRNPMISGVILILLGEWIALRTTVSFAWFAGFLVLNLTYIPLLEEPALAERFGDEYERYRDEVPRWIPRLRSGVES